MISKKPGFQVAAQPTPLRGWYAYVRKLVSCLLHPCRTLRRGGQHGSGTGQAGPGEAKGPGAWVLHIGRAGGSGAPAAQCFGSNAGGAGKGRLVRGSSLGLGRAREPGFHAWLQAVPCSTCGPGRARGCLMPAPQRRNPSTEEKRQGGAGLWPGPGGCLASVWSWGPLGGCDRGGARKGAGSLALAQRQARRDRGALTRPARALFETLAMKGRRSTPLGPMRPPSAWRRRGCRASLAARRVARARRGQQRQGPNVRNVRSSAGLRSVI